MAEDLKTTTTSAGASFPPSPARADAGTGQATPAETTHPFNAETVEQAADLAADFVLQTLAKALGAEGWYASDGSETWEGDVAGTVYNILRAARVLDPETDEVARHAK